MTKKISIILIILLVTTISYFVFIKFSDDKIIENLRTSWLITQNSFSVKAGESGTYNKPNKVQFISKDTLLVHYDDGLVDHTSILKYKNGAFNELKNVGVLSNFPLSEWQVIVKTYGDQNFSPINYTISMEGGGDYKVLTKTSVNVFVK
jgi:hypothetical protein